MSYNSVMDNLLQSRLHGAEAAQRLEGLSPERFGRGAYASLSYTPSKLAGNVLFKEAVSMRRVEESNSKAREGEAMVQLLRDKLRHLQEEKAGVQTALSQQIAMYKRILAEAEAAHEKTLLALQAAFSEEMQRLILLKEQEAKFVQSEKELLENRILELEQVIATLKSELESEAGKREAAEQTLAELERQRDALKQENGSLLMRIKDQADMREKERQQREMNTARKEQQMRAEHARLLQQAVLDKQKAIDALTATHRQQLVALEQQRISEAKAREDEVKQLRTAWEAETRRLQEVLHIQKGQTQAMSDALQHQKEKAAESIRKLTSQLASLSLLNQQLEKEVQTISRQLNECREQARRTDSASTQTTANMQAVIEKLKRQVESIRKDASALLSQRQRYRMQGDELKMEIVVLRKSVQRTSLLLQQNSLLSREVKGLKDLLVQSSLEMQRCKGEFLRMEKEKEILLAKLQELDLENDTLYRVRLQMEEEARIWRQTYYLNRK